MTATETCQAAGIGVDFIKSFVAVNAPRRGSGVCWGASRGVPADGFQPTGFDYKVIAAAIRLRAALPPSHASTSIMKTLRGNAVAAVCKNRPEFGMLEGMKVYNNQAIFCMIDRVQKMLADGDVSEDDSCNAPDEDDHNAEYAPCFIRDNLVRTNKGWANEIADAVEACGQEFGMAAPEPEKKKSKTVKVKTEALWETIRKAGLLPQARVKGKQLCDEFITSQPSNDTECWRYESSADGLRSKTSKTDHIVVKFYIGKWRNTEENWEGMRIAKMKPNTGGNPWVRAYQDEGKSLYGYIEKAAVMVAKMSLDGKKVLEWNVTLENFKAKW